MDVIVVPQEDVPSHVLSQVRALHDRAWPEFVGDPGSPLHDAALRPVVLLLVEDECVVSSAEVLTVTVVHEGRDYLVSGLSCVVTDEDRRGEGCASRIAAVGRDVMEQLGADLGLFTCDRGREGPYLRGGWEVLPGTVLLGGTATDPFPSDQPGFDKVTLAAFFSPNAKERRQSFVGAHIALHPGHLDRLF